MRHVMASFRVLPVHLGLVIPVQGALNTIVHQLVIRYCANSARRKLPHAQVSSRVIGQAVQASTLTAGPAAFFNSAGQFGPVDLALHWPEGASERTFGPQGCSFCAGPKCKSDRDVAAI